MSDQVITVRCGIFFGPAEQWWSTRSGQNQLRAKRARRLTDSVRYEARRIAANIAKPLELLR